MFFSIQILARLLSIKLQINILYLIRQMMKVFFDEEVVNEKIDKFRHALLKIRYPPSVLDFFCFGSTNLFDLLNNQSLTMSMNANNMPDIYAQAQADVQDPFLSGTLAGNSNNNGIISNRNFYAPTISVKTKEKHTDTIR